MLKTVIVLALIFMIHKVSADDEKGLQACMDVIKPENWRLHCCDINHKMGPTNERAKNINCPFPAPGEEWTCAHSECPLKTFGFLVDGKLDYDAIKKYQDEYFKENPHPEMQQMLNEANKECTEENLKEFPENMCLAQKYETCVMLVSMWNCPKWKTDDETCKKMAENSKLCNDAMKSMEK